ncbi:4Fe-4S dicluster domain-containing protein [Chloroflexota bacterium]
MKNFVEEVAATPGGEHIWDCIQCGVCTGTCPAAGEMEYPPRKTIALIRAGMRDKVLSSSSMWHCLSCYLCTVRCPRDVKPTELAHALEYLSNREGFKARGTYTPAMYRSFVSSIKSNGRVHEFGMMLRYYLTTNLLAALKMWQVGLSLLLHRRLPLMPKRVRGKEDLSRIIKKFREVRESR